MNAIELLDSIPDAHKDGRGRQDFDRLQRELSVKVVFLESNHHVLLIRNILSHYHWQTSGMEVQ